MIPHEFLPCMLLLGAFPAAQRGVEARPLATDYIDDDGDLDQSDDEMEEDEDE